MRRTSAKRNPLFKGATPLEFTGLSESETLQLTDAQESERFLSKWLEVMHPFTKYKRYFDESEKSQDHILREVKNYYLKYVVRGTWPERKYVMIVDSILINRFNLTPKVFEGREKLFDEERLEAQLLEKRVTRRKRL